MFSLSDICEATGGRVIQEGRLARFTGVSIDSRMVADGDVFVAIVGDRHDAHTFISEVVARGAGCVVAEAKRLGRMPAGAAFVAVSDTTKALGLLASFHRRRLPVRVLCLTGTNGKTTTKEMLFLVFSTTFSTLKTKGNLNNHIGLPLTLLSLNAAHQWALCEAGMNHPGEIAYLAGLARPQIGLITNVGRGHLEGVGSIEGVAAAKRELLESMQGGVAVLNADDPLVARMAEGFPGEVLFFGLGDRADVRAEGIRPTPEGQEFTLSLSGRRVAVALRAFGRHMVENACAAAAAGHAAGIPPEKIAAGLSEFSPVAGRLVPRPLPSGASLLDDTYNANPQSMAAALETLKAVAGGRRAFAVLGDMFELGAYASEEHKKLGRLAGSLGLSGLFVTGDFAGETARGAKAAGMPEDRIFSGGRDEVIRSLSSALADGDWVLVKGSRGMAMETIVSALLGA